MTRYKVVRMYRDHDWNKVIKHGLTLEQAQEYCQDPETSSSTCTDKWHERKFGPWFDGYEEVKS